MESDNFRYQVYKILAELKLIDKDTELKFANPLDNSSLKDQLDEVVDSSAVSLPIS
jgi:hypothetical protein